MKRALTIIAGLILLGAILFGIFIAIGVGGPRRELQATMKKLRDEGFKTDVADFAARTRPEIEARVAALTAFGSMPFNMLTLRLNYMAPVTSNSALVLWKMAELPSTTGADGWPELRDEVEKQKQEAARAAIALLSGPVKFELQTNANSLGSFALPELMVMRSWAQAFSSATILKLHDGDKDSAWTNLLALTRLVTAWEPGPAEISHLVRIGCADSAYKGTWQALQGGGWDDAQLAQLQREWESVDFFKGLPESCEFAAATSAAIYEREREGTPHTGLSIHQLTHQPTAAWSSLQYAWQTYRYLHHDSYEDEIAMLLDFRQRETELREALQKTTWAEMRAMPAATNSFAASIPRAPLGRFPRPRIGTPRLPAQMNPLNWAAEAEARRRILITAIALERFHLRHGNYPATLAELSPEFLQKPLPDFMDGEPLRYEKKLDGHFTLYSTGLYMDGTGRFTPNPTRSASQAQQEQLGLETSFAGFNRKQTDLLWPRPATEREVQKALLDEKHRAQIREAARQAQLDEMQKQADARRQFRVRRLMSEADAAKDNPPSIPDPPFNSKPLSQTVADTNVLGTNHVTLGQLLTLKQITTGEEPAKATFELPISYDVVTNFGELKLLVDVVVGDPEADDASEYGQEQSCERATNGNCLLVWNTVFDPPGQHVVRAALQLRDGQVPVGRGAVEAFGPLLPYYSSNLCQFSEFYNNYDLSMGATFHVKLIESNAAYKIEIQSPVGTHIITFNGKTTNGIINVHWDLVSEHGVRYTNDSFNDIYDIRFPDGRREIIK